MVKPPPRLDEMPNASLREYTYTAIRSERPYQIYDNVVNCRKPSIEIKGFGDADSGIVSAIVKNTIGNPHVQGSISLISKENNNGVYGAFLNVDDTVDHYSTSPDKSLHGHYNELCVRIGGNKCSGTFEPSNSIEYSMQLSHSDTGKSNIVNFYVDDPGIPSISDAKITSFHFKQDVEGSMSNRYVSGVPTFLPDDCIVIQARVNNCIRKFYNANWTMSAGGIGTQNTGYTDILSVSTASPTGEQRNEGSNPILVCMPKFRGKYFDNDIWHYNENVLPIVTARNSAGHEISGYPMCNKKIRIDTFSLQTRSVEVSDFVSETDGRICSCHGLYPTNLSHLKKYNPNANLNSNYELQLLNGRYQIPPPVDYSNSLPMGPDYSNLPYDSKNNNMRYFTQYLYPVESARFITLHLLGAENFTECAIQSDIMLQLIIIKNHDQDNVNPDQPEILYLDLNKSRTDQYGHPTENGHGILIEHNSSKSIKRGDFGSMKKSGHILVRIGFPKTSNKKIGGFTMTHK